MQICVALTLNVRIKRKITACLIDLTRQSSATAGGGELRCGV
jgi:hypothetical protein